MYNPGVEEKMKKEAPSSRRRLPALPVCLTAAVLLAALTAGLSLFVLSGSGGVYADPELLRNFLPSDWLNLTAGVLFPAAGLILMLLRRPAGLPVLAGALFHGFYLNFPYLVAVPADGLFVFRLILTAGCLSALAGLLLSAKPSPELRNRASAGAVRFSGTVLILLGALVLFRQAGLALKAATGTGVVLPADLALWIDDLVFAVPAMLLSGILLLRRHPLGETAGAAMLLAYGILSLELIPFLFIRAGLGSPPPAPADLAVLGFMGALCLVPFFLLLKPGKSRKY